LTWFGELVRGEEGMVDVVLVSGWLAATVQV
jgi:hypothetical protein